MMLPKPLSGARPTLKAGSLPSFKEGYLPQSRAWNDLRRTMSYFARTSSAVSALNNSSAVRFISTGGVPSMNRVRTPFDAAQIVRAAVYFHNRIVK
jgi:hypothetical protein